LAIGRHGLHRAREIGAIDGADVANGAVEHLSEDRALGVVIAPAEPCHDREVLLLGNLHRLDDGADAGGIRGHGLLGEDVFARLDGGAEVAGPEAGRRGEYDEVHAALDDLLEGIDAHKLPVGGHVELLVILHRAFHGGEAAFDRFGEGVAHGPQLDVAVGLEGLRGGTGATPAAADEADAELVAVGRGAQKRRKGDCADGKPMRSLSLLGAARRSAGKATAPTAVAAVEVWMNSRREVGDSGVMV